MVDNNKNLFSCDFSHISIIDLSGHLSRACFLRRRGIINLFPSRTHTKSRYYVGRRFFPFYADVQITNTFRARRFRVWQIVIISNVVKPLVTNKRTHSSSCPAVLTSPPVICVRNLLFIVIFLFYSSP